MRSFISNSQPLRPGMKNARVKNLYYQQKYSSNFRRKLRTPLSRCQRRSGLLFLEHSGSGGWRSAGCRIGIWISTACHSPEAVLSPAGVKLQPPLPLHNTLYAASSALDRKTAPFSRYTRLLMVCNVCLSSLNFMAVF